MDILHIFFKKNGPKPASFCLFFGLFQTIINTILQQINVKKCPSSMRHRDLNPRPLKRESPPITTMISVIFGADLPNPVPCSCKKPVWPDGYIICSIFGDTTMKIYSIA